MHHFCFHFQQSAARTILKIIKICPKFQCKISTNSIPFHRKMENCHCIRVFKCHFLFLYKICFLQNFPQSQPEFRQKKNPFLAKNITHFSYCRIKMVISASTLRNQLVSLTSFSGTHKEHADK